jgi:Tfp pilus assembly protein FimT
LGTAIFLILASSPCLAASWQLTVSKDPPGNFPELRPLRATYYFGWAGLTAATADVHFSKASDKRLQLEGTGRTSGLARALWRYDVNYRASADADTLRPIDSKQTETTRSKKVVTHLSFSPEGVTRARTEGAGAGSTKTKEFNLSNLFDLQSALLYLRSQPLKDRNVQRLVVYPATSAYLATVTVLGREKISVRAGSYPAIKADLQLNRLGKNLELEPHRKFRRATVWLSDDADRIILRIEAQIFIGTVFAELQSVRFESAR